MRTASPSASALAPGPPPWLSWDRRPERVLPSSAEPCSVHSMASRSAVCLPLGSSPFRVYWPCYSERPPQVAPEIPVTGLCSLRALSCVGTVLQTDGRTQLSRRDVQGVTSAGVWGQAPRPTWKWLCRRQGGVLALGAQRPALSLHSCWVGAGSGTAHYGLWQS